MNRTQAASITVSFLVGLDENNNPLITKQTFRNVSGEASVASIRTTAEAIANVLGLEVFEIERTVREQL